VSEWSILYRLSVKPAIAALGQVTGNQRVRDFADVVRPDCKYFEKWSLRMDLRIAARIVKKSFRADAW
jgi:lipopolysaccharide/colanic/teichoic acid biosynthesis glycosyltransferase